MTETVDNRSVVKITTARLPNLDSEIIEIKFEGDKAAREQSEAWVYEQLRQILDTLSEPEEGAATT